MKRRQVLALPLIVLPLLAGTAHGQAKPWPSQPLRFIVPFAPGGGSDLIARALSNELKDIMGTPVIVENKAGANGAIATQALAHAGTDGYAVMICSPGIQITNRFLYERLGYDPDKDIAPVVQIAKLPNLMVVHPSVPAQSVSELIAYARANPGKLNFASTGNGASSHLACELFKMMAQVEITHVPFLGSAPAATNLIGGHVQMTIDSLTAMYRHVQAGNLRVLGVSTAKRLPDYPDIPAIAETLPGFEGSSMVYAAAPGGTPPALIAKLNEAFNQALDHPRVKGRFKELGMAAPSGGTLPELVSTIGSETEKWKRVIEAAKLKKI